MDSMTKPSIGHTHLKVADLERAIAFWRDVMGMDLTQRYGDQAAFMGTMGATLITSGKETGTFSWAVRVEVKDGKVKSWNWFEDSFSVSNAFHGK